MTVAEEESEQKQNAFIVLVEDERDRHFAFFIFGFNIHYFSYWLGVHLLFWMKEHVETYLHYFFKKLFKYGRIKDYIFEKVGSLTLANFGVEFFSDNLYFKTLKRWIDDASTFFLSF